jgi:hypothetical protein
LEKIMKPILAFITILTLFSGTGAAWTDSFGSISYRRKQAPPAGRFPRAIAAMPKEKRSDRATRTPTIAASRSGSRTESCAVVRWQCSGQE